MAATGRSGDVPVPSTNATYSGLTGSAAVYNGTSTKVTMGAPVLAAGKAPLSPFRAQYQNAWENDVGKRLDHLDLAECTFVDSGALADATGASGFRLRSAAAHHLVGRPLAAHVYGGDTVWKSIDGGHTWTSWDSAVGRYYIDVAEHLGSSIAAIAAPGGVHRIYAFDGTAWASAALIDTAISACIVGKPSASRYYIGGRGGALGNTSVWKVIDGSGGAFPMTQTRLAHTDLVSIEYIACGPSGNVGCSTAKSYTWADADTALTLGGTPVASGYIVQGLVYDETRSRFVAVTGNGTNTVFRASTDDGVTWTTIGTVASVAAQDYSVSIRGGVIVFGAIYGGEDYLAISADGGLTAELVPNPLTRESGAGATVVQHTSHHQNRLFVAGYRAAGSTKWAGAIKTGRTY